MVTRQLFAVYWLAYAALAERPCKTCCCEDKMTLDNCLASSGCCARCHTAQLPLRSLTMLAPKLIHMESSTMLHAPGPSSLLHQQGASNRQPAQGCIIRDHPGWCMAATNMYWQKAVLPGTVSGVLLLYCGMLAWGCNMFVAGSTLEISFQKFSAVTMTTSPPSTCSMSARCFPLKTSIHQSSTLLCKQAARGDKGPIPRSLTAFSTTMRSVGLPSFSVFNLQRSLSLSYKRCQRTRAKRQEPDLMLISIAKLNVPHWTEH